MLKIYVHQLNKLAEMNKFLERQKLRQLIQNENSAKMANYRPPKICPSFNKSNNNNKN